jgi:regulator of sigma E protease
MLITVLATVVVLGVLIFVHELGHFLTAKAVDIEVPRFSIGFGPKVIGFTRGETEYVISLLPLGGYVKMAGMEELEMVEGPTDSPRAEGREPNPRHFEAKSLPARVLVISAGVLMNVLFAIVVFGATAGIWGVPIEPPPIVGGVAEEYLPEGAEALAELPAGARITAIDGEPVEDWGELRLRISTLQQGPNTIEFANAAPVQVNVASSDSVRAMLFLSLEPQVSTPPVLQQIAADGPAAAAGLEDGDLVIEVDGRPITSWQEFVAAVEANAAQSMPISVQRDGARVDLAVTPRADTLPNGRIYGRIGVAGAAAQSGVPRERVAPLAAAAYGVERTWDVVVLTVDFLGGMFTGRHSARNIGGPIEIGRISGQVARAGMETFLNFMALFSVNLAVLNLLPIPVLDGGQLVFLLVEGVRGRPLSVTQRMRLTQVGFIIILLIMAWAIGNDVLRALGI